MLSSHTYALNRILLASRESYPQGANGLRVIYLLREDHDPRIVNYVLHMLLAGGIVYNCNSIKLKERYTNATK